MKLLIFALTFGLTILLSNFYLPETAEATPSPNDLVVHEWGTFTSIAGKNGMAIDWRPLAETSDLPKFVYTIDGGSGFRNTYESTLKGKTKTLAKVRMETPVIYFYTKHEQEVSVKVDFPSGKITEWYPQANIVNNYAGNYHRASFGQNGIEWGTIKLLPNEKPDFLREVGYSHYYPARETDAVPIQVCNADKTKIEKEKFLFYRGIGDYGLPLNVKIDGGNLILKDDGTDEVKNIIVFENRGGRIGFKFLETLEKEMIIARPETNKTVAEVYAELEKILVAEGLYAKEAKAMIETWKDSWFEEGLRVFYILTSKSANKILPLKVEPKPKETVRVFVGRAEVITPEMEQAVRKQVGFLRSNSKKIREQAQANLKKYGRFYEPILKSILETEKDEKVRTQIRELIEVS